MVSKVGQLGTAKEKINRLAQKRPVHSVVVGDEIIVEGMSLRQYYAGLAMQGLINFTDLETASVVTIKQVTRQAVRFADHLLHALDESDLTPHSQ